MLTRLVASLSAAILALAVLSPVTQAVQLTDPSPTVQPGSTLPIIDYCARKSNGVVRSITEGLCTRNELSLGAGPITKAAKRPVKLRAKMSNRVKAAQAAGKKKGYVLRITSGWRSLSTQKYLFNRSIKNNGRNQKWVLPPELSNHPWGLAVDINYKSGKKAGAKWLEKNGYKWGLCRAYKNEWWHFEPLTTPGKPCPAPIPYPVW